MHFHLEKKFEGSIPSRPTFAPLVQWILEHFATNEEVGVRIPQGVQFRRFDKLVKSSPFHGGVLGSSPRPMTIYLLRWREQIRQGSSKPLYAGAIPARSTLLIGLQNIAAGVLEMAIYIRCLS